MRHLKLTLAYDGTNFAGWQWQPEQRTIQGALEAAIREITGEQTRITSSGRTDAGVHAIRQVVSWATESKHPTDVLLRGLNANTPRDMAIHSIEEAREGFHAIRDSVSKRYRYLVYDARIRDVFSRHYVWQLWHPLNADAMHEAAQSLLGEHDFKSYETSGSPRLSSVRTIHEISVERRATDHGERIVIEVEANGFLYNMVRNIVGTLVEVGNGKHTISWPGEVLSRLDRREAGATAPPQGLYLVNVNY